jgi:hypothetical protein
LFLQTRGDLYKVCPRGKEVTDEGESRSDPAAWSSVWISTKALVGVSPGVVEPALDYKPRASRRASSGGFAKFISKTGLTMSSISPVAGLQCVVDGTQKWE